MSQYTTETYLDVPYSEPAYTWTSSANISLITYRPEQMPPSLNANTWQTSLTCCPGSPHATPMSFQNHSLTLSSPPEATVRSSPPPAPTLVVFDDHCHPTPENVSIKGGLKGARKALRRPNPVAVPNLTKKARGRPVPTKDTLLKGGNGRTYVCTVEDCQKVFTRAEHLKRHTRSIHTNERPFACNHTHCGRSFTRHDNLLQHLKNHRQLADMPSVFGPLERVSVPPPPSPSDTTSVSPSMGVLIPPLARLSVPSANKYEASYEDAEQELLDEAGERTQGPTEGMHYQYNYGYTWPQSDIRSLPPSQAPFPPGPNAAEPRYPQAFRERVQALGFAFNT